MLSPVDEQFRSARLKIKRANKHIAEVEARISILPNEYAASIQVDPQTGNEFLEYGISQGSEHTSDLALMIGDAIHNLKCALDYSWIGALMKHPMIAPQKSNKFPVYPTRELLENALRDRKIDESAPGLYDLIVSEIQPYDGGDSSMRAIHILDRRDKHTLLVPLLNVTFLHGLQVQNPGGDVRSFDWALTRPGPYRIEVLKGSKIKDKGQIAVIVVFNQGTPTHDVNVLSALTQFRQATISVVELFQGI
jgi:hypothetical protein